MMHSKKSNTERWVLKTTISRSLACLPDSNNLQVYILVDITHAVVFCLGLSNCLLVNLSTILKLSTCVIFEYVILSIDGIVVEGESLPNISVY